MLATPVYCPASRSYTGPRTIPHPGQHRTVSGTIKDGVVTKYNTMLQAPTCRTIPLIVVTGVRSPNSTISATSPVCCFFYSLHPKLLSLCAHSRLSRQHTSTHLPIYLTCTLPHVHQPIISHFKLHRLCFQDHLGQHSLGQGLPVPGLAALVHASYSTT